MPYAYLSRGNLKTDCYNGNILCSKNVIADKNFSSGRQLPCRACRWRRHWTVAVARSMQYVMCFRFVDDVRFSDNGPHGAWTAGG